jgi:hypothetical protein
MTPFQQKIRTIATPKPENFVLEAEAKHILSLHQHAAECLAIRPHDEMPLRENYWTKMQKQRTSSFTLLQFMQKHLAAGIMR